MALHFRNHRAMLHSGGWRYVWDTFRQVHWFDLKHRVDTAEMLGIHEYSVSEFDLKGVVQYQPTWTKSVDDSFMQVSDFLGDSFSSWAFVDLGCGKGKVLLEWIKQCEKKGVNQRYLGIEIEPKLSEIAIRNLSIMWPRVSVKVHTCNAIVFRYQEIGRPLILFLQNPFDEGTMRLLAGGLAEIDHMLVLVNPSLSGFIQALGYTEIARTEGHHQHARSSILIPDSGSSGWSANKIVYENP